MQCLGLQNTIRYVRVSTHLTMNIIYTQQTQSCQQKQKRIKICNSPFEVS